MKFKIECQSPLLQKSLQIFLKEYLSEDGILITDKNSKESFVIGKNIKIPFTKEQLLSELETFYKESSFERKIEILTQNFIEDLIKIIKDEYEKK